MRRFAPVAAVLAAAMLTTTTSSTQPRADNRLRVEQVDGRDAAAGEVLLKLRASWSPRDLVDINGLANAESVTPLGRTGMRRLRSRSRDARALVRLLANHPAVAYAEPNYIVHTFADPPDPLAPQLWGLQNVGQAVNNGLAGQPGADIHAAEAWDVSVGSTAHVVAVIDTGIDYTHPDLAANLWSAPAPFTVTIGGVSITCPAGSHGFNAIALTCDPMDDHNHGTHVAGTIGAAAGNGAGVVGVNWITQLMGVKFLNASGSGTIADAINGLDFVMQTRQAFAATGGADVRVLSNSWGGRSFSQALRDEIAATADADMLFVAAAGNDGFSNDILPTYPASYDVGQHHRRGGHDQHGRPGVLLELRRGFGRSRRARRGHPVDDHRQHLQLLERDVDGHAARLRRRGARALALQPGHGGLEEHAAEHGAAGRRAGLAHGDGRPPRRQQRHPLVHGAAGCADRADCHRRQRVGGVELVRRCRRHRLHGQAVRDLRWPLHVGRHGRHGHDVCRHHCGERPHVLLRRLGHQRPWRKRRFERSLGEAEGARRSAGLRPRRAGKRRSRDDD